TRDSLPCVFPPPTSKSPSFPAYTSHSKQGEAVKWLDGSDTGSTPRCRASLDIATCPHRKISVCPLVLSYRPSSLFRARGSVGRSPKIPRHTHSSCLEPV